MSVAAGGFSDDFPMTMEVESGMDPRHCPAVAVAFGMFPVVDTGASKKAGHDVFKDVEHIKIAVPGDKHSLHFQPSTPVYRARFPQAYKAFQNRATTPVEGMPIEQWAVVSRSLALTMRACNIHTVEALAAVHDGHIDKLGFNAREMREKAKAWLANAKDNAATMTLAAEKQDLKDQLAVMQAQIAALTAAGGKAPQASAQVQAPVDPTANVEQDVAAAARRPRRAA